VRDATENEGRTDDGGRARHHRRRHSRLDDHVRDRLARSRALAALRESLPHPHLDDKADGWTRALLGRAVPAAWQRRLRDSGGFRALCDAGAAAVAAPALALAHPSSAGTFWELTTSEARARISYGPHPRQVVDVYLPRGEGAPRKRRRRRMVAFVHGGAWGRCVRECVRAGGDGPGF
jgi:hypothetical protein